VRAMGEEMKALIVRAGAQRIDSARYGRSS